jgi:hypothetical protein
LSGLQKRFGEYYLDDTPVREIAKLIERHSQVRSGSNIIPLHEQVYCRACKRDKAVGDFSRPSSLIQGRNGQYRGVCTLCEAQKTGEVGI